MVAIVKVIEAAIEAGVDDVEVVEGETEGTSWVLTEPKDLTALAGRQSSVGCDILFSPYSCITHRAATRWTLRPAKRLQMLVWKALYHKHVPRQHLFRPNTDRRTFRALYFHEMTPEAGRIVYLRRSRTANPFESVPPGLFHFFPSLVMGLPVHVTSVEN